GHFASFAQQRQPFLGEFVRHQDLAHGGDATACNRCFYGAIEDQIEVCDDSTIQRELPNIANADSPRTRLTANPDTVDPNSP
ncbi:MAG: hypothetical protein ABIP94_18235, partial [Planctomycetota bacterium]